MNDGEGCFVVVAIVFLMFIAGFAAGEAIAQQSHEEMLVEKNLAHYDPKTKDFILHEPCQGTED